jgi:mono/diheme cytochrome c family protein
MSAPLRVFLAWLSIALVLVVVVFYRYDLISGIKRTMGSSSAPVAEKSEASAPAAQAKSNETVAVVDAASLENGKKLYEAKTCALCHGANGKADTPTGMAMKATNLTSGVFDKNTQNMAPTDYILHVIENGVPGTAMVSFKAQIPDEKDRKDLSNYVVSLAGKK